MNLLDVIIICVLTFLVVRGIFRGFIREFASLAGIVLGVWQASRFQPQFTEYLKTYLPASFYLSWISFGAIFFLTLVVCNLLGWLLHLIMKKAFLGWFDRTLGAGFAILKGVILTYLVIIILTFFLPAATPLIAGSKMAPWINASSQAIIRLISPDFLEKWRAKFVGGKPDGPVTAPAQRGNDPKK